MKRIILYAAALLSLFSACDLFDVKEDGEAEAFVRVYEGRGDSSPLYIRLAQPDAPAAAGNSTFWDIIVHDQRELLTNSGATAAGLASGGQGGIVYSGTGDFSAHFSRTTAQARFAAAAAASGIDKGVDFSYYSKLRTTSAAPSSTRTGNAASFPGFKTQDGRDGAAAASAWAFGDPGAHVDADFSLGSAYARWEMMNPSFSGFNENVYLIRSGDGLRYYKLQVLESVYTAAVAGVNPRIYTFKLRFKELGE